MSIFEYNQERHMMQEREAAWNEGKESGRQEGIQEGIQKGIREIVQNMLRQGLTDEQIKNYCNITSEELEKFKEE
ncbi:hypothetical protein LKD70_10550 [Ruminococcus sp. CLA-AA-H200]|uniref:Flagellar assembly protein H n=1 Tax=Ruminococcus turbiniformis TaxID=2881258 RepID=A0ABS8FY00_9FIRM|nr:hypothetical protein [Ruminococcus turbiniformis]MCC2254851.1 hypothetical protein [Ruminococcus turbiniformis]